jgi:hypothetical protein
MNSYAGRLMGKKIAIPSDLGFRLQALNSVPKAFSNLFLLRPEGHGIQKSVRASSPC